MSTDNILIDLPLKYLVHAPSDTKDKPLIIFLHGYGGNEENLFTIKENFIPECTYVSVRAPIPLFHRAYQWYNLQTPSTGLVEVARQIQSSTRLLEEFIIKATQKYETDSEKVILVGFSQGATISYELALRRPLLVRGIIALSGTILPFLKAEIKPGHDLKSLAIFIGHGDMDSTVPISAAIAARDTLSQTTVVPSFHQYPYLGHSTNDEEIEDVKKWILGILEVPRLRKYEIKREMHPHAE